MKYIAVSGGADSTALALLLWKRGEEFEMVFSDTGAELPEVYWLLPKLSHYIGRRLNVVHNGSFFQHLVAQNWFLPGPNVRWCTRILKQTPQDRFFETVKAETVYIGIRADEPKRLSYPKPRHGIHTSQYPLAEAGLDKKEVLELCRKHKLLNPVYDWRSSVSCFCCFFQRMGDWRGLWKHHPTLFKIAEEWEEQSILNNPGCAKYTWIGRDVKLRNIRRAKESEISLWPELEPESPPCLICAI